MTRKHLLLGLLMMSFISLSAQYTFTDTERIDCTPIKNQQNTGTCWSFATASLIESEVARLNNKSIDLSEMYIVRNIYQDKAMNYLLRQGKAQFSQGSLSHDLVNMIDKVGVMPESAYSGLISGAEGHNHSEMEAGLKGYLDGINSKPTLSPKWMEAFTSILDTYIGAAPNDFTYEGKQYTPQKFATHLGIEPDNYVSVSSFTHHPFGETFILEVPDNYSNGSYYNVPIDDLVEMTKKAIKNGYTLAWDGDVSEKGFSAKEGIAVLPANPKREDLFTAIGPEIEVTQEKRQQAFMVKSTTDDHLMHIVGTSADQNGNTYFIIKNSWGEVSPYKGYLYMSEAYFRMKTVAVMVHIDATKNYIN